MHRDPREALKVGQTLTTTCNALRGAGVPRSWPSAHRTVAELLGDNSVVFLAACAARAAAKTPGCAWALANAHRILEQSLPVHKSTLGRIAGARSVSALRAVFLHKSV